jgi:hypothetical protein
MCKILNNIYFKIYYFICVTFLYKRVIELYKENDMVFGKTYYQFKYWEGIKYKYIGNNKLLIIKNK